MKFMMSARTKLRDDFDADGLRSVARTSKDAAQTRRLLALASIYDGGSHLQAARIGGVSPQIVRDWIVRFNAHDAAGLINGRAPGPVSKLTDEHRRALAKKVDDGPDPAVHGVVRWRLKDLVAWLAEEHGLTLDETTVGRALKALGYRKLSARPRHHAQDEHAIADFLKNFPAAVEGLRAKLLSGTVIEIWWQDEALIGQKNGITRRWAKRGTRPSAPHDQRTASAYLFGAICPKAGKAAGLVLPRCTTAAMNAHLVEIGQAVAPGAHAILVLDKAGWHTTAKLTVAVNITLVPLPPRGPELNPVENIWQYLRQNWLSNRIFNSYEDIVGICCEAWNKLVDLPDVITSIGLREWAYPS